MKAQRHTKKRKISNMTIIILIILGVVLIGDIIGALIYLRQSPQVQAELLNYLATGDSLSFWQIFWQQFLYQFTIWTMGLTIIGNFVNIFLVFMRGVSTGFNIALIVGEVSLGVLILWLVQHLLIIFTTILSAYFSLRFAYMVIKTVLVKKYNLLPKQFKLYATQLIVIMVLTMATAVISAITAPLIPEQLTVPEVVGETYINGENR